MFYKKKSKFIIMITLVLIFLVIIIFYYENIIMTKSKTIQLDNSLFDNNILNTEAQKEIEIKNIKRISEVNTPTGIDWYNDEEIIMTTRYEEKSSLYKYNVILLDIKNASSNKILTGIAHEKSLSPNKEKILYYDYKGSSKPFINVYDIKSKNLISTQQFDRFLSWFPDSRGYIGISDGYLFKYDLTNNTKANLFEYKVNQNNIININITKDGESLYIFSFNPKTNDNSILLVDLKAPEGVTKILEGKMLNYEILNNETLIVNGKFNGKNGIFYYDITNKKLDMLVDGYCLNFKLSNDKMKIAYSKTNDSGRYTLWSASIDKNKTQNNLEVFNNNFPIDSFEWSNDVSKLAFVIQENFKKDYLYIAEFK